MIEVLKGCQVWDQDCLLPLAQERFELTSTLASR